MTVPENSGDSFGAAARLTAGREALARADFPRAEHEATEVLARDPASAEAAQLLALTYLSMGETERGRTLLERRDEFQKTATYAGWGEIAEQLALLDVAEGIYTDHLSRYPQDAAAHYQSGLVALACERRDDARLSFLSATRLDPTLPQPATELARLYEEEGLLGAAAELYDRALSLTPDDAELLVAREVLATRLQELRALPEIRLEPAQEAVNGLLRLFSGREGVYARQWTDGEGHHGYAPVREPLTERVLESHLRGDLTAGVYVLRNDNTVRFLAFDIDITKQALTRAADNPDERQRLDALELTDVRSLVRLLDGLGLPRSIEASGYKGYHVWLCFETPIPAVQVRAFAGALLRQVGAPPDGLHREIFPKQDQATDDQLGNLIKLPLGVHRKTGSRALFVDEEGRAYADQVAYLNTIRTVSPAVFDEAIRRLMGTTPPAASATVPVSRTPTGTVGSTLPALSEKFPRIAPVWERCTVVRTLMLKAQTDHHLLHAERVVLACVFAHLGEDGKALLHAVIANCLDYDPEITRYQIERTHPNPISCPRIRQRLPDLTARASCSCPVALPEKGYPSPVLFAEPQATADKARPSTEQADTDSQIRRYVDTVERWRAAQRELETATAALMQRVEKTPEGTLSTDVWRVTRDAVTGELRVELRSHR